MTHYTNPIPRRRDFDKMKGQKLFYRYFTLFEIHFQRDKPNVQCLKHGSISTSLRKIVIFSQQFRLSHQWDVINYVVDWINIDLARLLFSVRWTK